MSCKRCDSLLEYITQLGEQLRMIKNKREYRITRAQADKFERSLEALEAAPLGDDVHPKIREIEAAALRSQLEELRNDIEEYEALKTREHDSLTSQGAT